MSHSLFVCLFVLQSSAHMRGNKEWAPPRNQIIYHIKTPSKWVYKEGKGWWVECVCIEGEGGEVERGRKRQRELERERERERERDSIHIPLPCTGTSTRTLLHRTTVVLAVVWSLNRLKLVIFVSVPTLVGTSVTTATPMLPASYLPMSCRGGHSKGKPSTKLRDPYCFMTHSTSLLLASVCCSDGIFLLACTLDKRMSCLIVVCMYWHFKVVLSPHSPFLPLSLSLSLSSYPPPLPLSPSPSLSLPPLSLSLPPPLSFSLSLPPPSPSFSSSLSQIPCFQLCTRPPSQVLLWASFHGCAQRHLRKSAPHGSG